MGLNFLPKSKRLVTGRARARRSLAAAGGLLAATLAAVPAVRAEISSPLVAGLPWRSGATAGGFPCLADLRHRALDAVNVYLAPQTFTDMVTNSGSWIPQYGTKAPLEVVSMALLPAQNKGQFSTCAAGAFDDYFRQVGANLQRSLALSVVVRLGWEANIGSGVHPWGVDTADQVPAYVQCWRHAALALKTGGPRLNLEWTNAKKTQNKALSVLAMYPGNDVVDLIGVHYYDTGPLKNTQTIWDKYYSMTFNDGPWGLGTWLKFAQDRGKKLGVGEWGIKQLSGQTSAMADDPVYMDNMYKFFHNNADAIAYETYFNGDTTSGGHKLCPSTVYPNAVAVYQNDWGLGQ